MTKKDYTDNWHSEMHETFCFWSFPEWKNSLEKEGFKIHNDSKTFSNEWIINNRYKDKIKLHIKKNNKFEEVDYPPTNMILIGEK